MPDARHFTKEDIGGELLPMLTTGLYRDSLDALREYIQNAIDARASQIDVSIDPSAVSVTDNGDGMNREQAERAIRLGISDKNPRDNVGFRGIGVYSAFNLCESLEIFTKPKRGGASHIVFGFRDIREMLLKERERRKLGKAPELFLEKLLQSHVYVEAQEAPVLEVHGTKVLMSDLLSEGFTRLQDWDAVEAYLQDVVPLPFADTFAAGVAIQKRFSEEDYRVVPLTLEIGSRKRAIFRPYSDGLFPEGRGHPPKFFTLKRGSHNFGFAWVCINGRRVIRDPRMRGLLIKKFGFSIGNRSYLEPFFKRTVFNRRITGEIIVQHEGLIPNAARSDFENNATRQEFLELLPEFIAHLSTWADQIQQNEKAREVLREVMQEVGSIAEELPRSQRDKDRMLVYNVQLADLERRLNTHKKTIQSLDDLSGEFDRTNELLKRCKHLVRDALSASVQSQKRLEANVVKVVQAETAIKEALPKAPPEPPRDLVAVLDNSGIRLSEEAQEALRLFEAEYLLSQIDRDSYVALLQQFQEALEDGD